MTQRDEDVLTRQWLTVADVQKITGRARTTILAALQSGDLEGHQDAPGHKWDIHEAAIDPWMRRNGRKAS